MGNNDGFWSAFVNFRRNEVIDFEDGCFSFAFGNEIALVFYDNRDKFYILNCSDKLWKEVKEFLKGNPKIDKIKSFWLKKSAKYEISRWSFDFGNLK